MAWIAYFCPPMSHLAAMKSRHQTPLFVSNTELDPQKLAAVRKRYAEEASKRLKPEGSSQFVPLTSADEERLRSLADDPWVAHEALNARPSPIKNDGRCRFFVLGAGYGGLQFAVRLIEEGIARSDEIRLADAAGGFGGTWTGTASLACIVMSRAMCTCRCLKRRATEHREPTENPIKRTFRAEKRVAVVGTPATAISVVPEVAKYAGELYVIQRTPAPVRPRGQHETNPKEFQTKVATMPGLQNLVNDAWTDMPAYSAIVGTPNHGVTKSSSKVIEHHADAYHALDLPHMESVRARVDELVHDPDTAAKLKPWYPSWCKRPKFSDTYLQTFNRPNVHLVDTDGKGPSRVTETGLVVGEKVYLLGVEIFGTGYQAPTAGSGSPAARTGINVTGRHGQSLDEKWRTKGAAKLHGYATNGFPNLFFSGTSQATITGKNVFMLGFIAQHIAYMIGEGERRVGRGQGLGQQQRAIIEVTRDSEEAHTAEIPRRAPPFYSVLTDVRPGTLMGTGIVPMLRTRKRRRRGLGG
ncbi:hypothetical protein AN3560.2 [Aspergillus nidulans FGSC A4]|uniref:FAD/NAD(P)-binding domain-containing protein n=1 Tax=Emericella nidulans (strain FGSC A4 / ATCC 38163 / CBS 112.46 / NRRL 194 / M139) TaxID=227321 RepID=Q5B7C0_EMENI|nr:hypothetical protein [Aspergillus nidulans FGSC A4]EAA59768.1 hypothetical protein AN3560.2 [Aspergillus nidulans FGSC A4]CBF75886.1 TPA: conserved hypothetical protein [Aspergillus nidulans FGSC A4]|eukprot:XP_661164.1 hypothetical protein AN3560.2 [Aspergillus nidulans FGSC A4]